MTFPGSTAYVHVVDWDTDESIRAVKTTLAEIDKVERGMNINLNHDKYRTVQSNCPHQAFAAKKCLQCAAGAK